MKNWIFIILAIIVWILLFALLYVSGMHIINSSQKQSLKKWKTEIEDYDLKKWKFKFYLITFFVGVPVLFIVALFKDHF